MYFSEQEMFCKYNSKELPDGVITNLMELRGRLNKLGFKPPRILSCAYRSPEHNTLVGGAKKSNHLTGCACDIIDSDGKLADYIMTNPELLEECDLYVENPEKTKGWVHLASVPPKSGNRVFKP